MMRAWNEDYTIYTNLAARHLNNLAASIKANWHCAIEDLLANFRLVLHIYLPVHKTALHRVASLYSPYRDPVIYRIL